MPWNGSKVAQAEYEAALRQHPPQPKRKKNRKAKRPPVARSPKPVKKAAPAKKPWVDYKDYLLGNWWRAKRKQKLKSVGNKCERCGGYSRLQVHHKHYRTVGCEKNTDLEALCAGCHEQHHEHSISMDNHLRAIQRQA